MTETYSHHIEGILKEFIYDFIKKDKQDRLFNFLKKERNWWKLKNEFHSSTFFNPKRLWDVNPNEQYEYAKQIFAIMREMTDIS